MVAPVSATVCPLRIVTSPSELVGVDVAATQVVPPSVDCNQVDFNVQSPEFLEINCLRTAPND